MTKKIINPILTGFNPDPCIVRVEDDYYIATSTFEWFPGVCLYHSRDLVNWRLIGYGLNSTKYIDLMGNPSSGGVWAPCLTYVIGRFSTNFSLISCLLKVCRESHSNASL